MKALDGPDGQEDVLIRSGLNLALRLSYVEAFGVVREASSDSEMTVYRNSQGWIPQGILGRTSPTGVAMPIVAGAKTEPSRRIDYRRGKISLITPPSR